MEDPYDKLEKIAPFTTFVQAKTYFGGGEWYTLDLDYPRIAKILSKVGYNGYASIEFEGKAPAGKGVPQSVELCVGLFPEKFLPGHQRQRRSVEFLGSAGGGYSSFLRLWRQSVDKGNGQPMTFSRKGSFCFLFFLKRLFLRA